MVCKNIAKSLFLPTFPILFPGAFDTAPKGTFQNAGKKSKKGDAACHALNTPYVYILLFMVIHKNRKIAFSTHVFNSLPRGILHRP